MSPVAGNPPAEKAFLKGENIHKTHFRKRQSPRSISMTITASVQKQFFRSGAPSSEELIRIPPTVIMTSNLESKTPQAPYIKTRRRLNLWTVEEHERFLVGLERFPQGPWKAVAEVVGTKTTRQTMTHAQKYRQKIRRQSAGQAIRLVKSPRSERSKQGAARAPRVSAASTRTATDSQPDAPSLAQDISGSALACVLDEWEIDTLLSQLSSSTDLQLDHLDGVSLETK